MRAAWLLAGLLLVLGTAPAAAQTIDATTYPFTFATGAALQDMSSGTTQLLGPDVDDAASSVVPAGFEFWFAGIRYTSFSISSNGLLKPGTSPSVAATNNLGSVLTAPQIAPYWDDLWIGSNGKVHYKVVGAAPNRTLVVEWLNMQVPRQGAGTPGSATFQCWIHETTGVIEFVYGGGIVTNTTQGGASIGLGSTTGAFASVTSLYPSASYGVANNSNVTPIASGTRYTFTPAIPTAPSNLVFSQLGAQTMTLGWTDLATNEVGYAVWRSTDGTNFDFVTQTAANTTSLLQTGLTPSTTYSWIVRAVTEGAVSDPLAGSQATSATGSIVSAGSGGWSSTVPGAPWPGGILPTASDSVTIADGSTVTVDAAASCFALKVGQGASGALQYEPVTARTLSVVGGVVVSPGAVLASASSGTQTGHTLSLGGGLLNQGTLDLSTNGNLAGATLSFTGGADASLSGSGALTDVRAITVNKSGTAAVTLDAPGFTVRGQTADTLGFLTLTSGTFHLAGSFAMTSPVFTTASYTLAAGTTFWLDNANFVVLPKAGSPTMRGLRVSAGLFQVGLFSNNSLQLGSGSQVTVEGGALRIAGRLVATATVTYVQSGGTVTVNTMGHNSTSQASFDLGTVSGSSTTISGGTIVLQRASTAGSGPRDYRNGAGTQNVSGGTLQVGSDSTGVASTFYISGTMPALVVSNLSGGQTARLFGASTVMGATHISSGATLDLNGSRLTQTGGNLVNDGTLASSAANSELYFLGTGTPQSYSGSGVFPAPMAVLTVDNSGGFSIDPAVASNLVTWRVNLIHGLLGNSQKLTLGNGMADTLSVVTQLGAAGLSGTAGSYDAAPSFNPGVGGVSVYYLQQGAPRITGFEIPATRALRDLSLDDPGGVVTIAGGPVALSRGLTLTSGLLQTTASNVVQLGDTASAVPAGSAQSYVDGPLTIAIRTPDTTSVSRTFAVGRDGVFRSIRVSGVLTGGAQQVLTAEVLAGPTGGTPSAPLQSLTTARYWRLGNSSGLNPGARVRLDFGTDDLVGDLGSAHVAQSSLANGSYSDLGGTVTGTPSAGTVTSTANLVPGSDYLVVGSAGSLSSVWDGGAGTSNWGDDANWNPDGVPDSTRDVTLSFGSPTTLHMSGNYAVKSLTVNGNTTLQLDSGLLQVKQDLSQSGGVVRLAGGAFDVRRHSSLLGGTLDVGAGAYTAGDLVWVPGGTLHISSGSAVLDSTLAIEGGTVSLETGVLEVRGDFWRTSGNYFSGTGTTIFSGSKTQYIGGAATHYNLVFRNGGAGQPKLLQSFLQHVVNNDLTVESTAQLDLNSSSATQLTVWGNLYYSGLTGGVSIGNLTLQLSGIGKTFSGSPTGAPAQLVADAGTSAAADAPVDEVNFRTEPTLAKQQGQDSDGKPLLVLENTYEKRKADIEQLLRTSDPRKRLVINLDDMTLVRNPESGAKSGLEASVSTTTTADAVATSTIPLAVTVASNAAYTLDGNVTMALNRTLTVGGRLDCSTFTIGGAGKLTIGLLGVLGTGTTSASGLAATVVTTGVSTYNDGSIVDYNAPGDQTINAGNHPAAAMIRTGGGGTKTLSGNKTISATSGSNLANGALFVGPGTTFADAGFRLSFTTTQIANVIVQGTYQSTGSGSISYESGAFSSNVQAVDGTAFGDLLMNFALSTSTVDMNAVGTSNVSFRNLTFGGTAGTANNGGTLRLSETGTTNVTVTGNVSIAPRTVSATGGGFGGTTGRTGQVSLLGNLTSTSTATTQPIMNNTGTNTLVFSGASRATLTVPVSATLFTGSKLKLAGSAGLQLAGSALTYSIGPGGALDLGSGNINTGTNTLALAAGDPLTRTTGRVVGRLKKGLPTGPGTAAFEIGTETADTPVSLAFGNVTAAGNISAATTTGDHPNIATSNLDATQSVNRYYNVTNEGATFDTCTVGLTFPATDIDAGADPSTFAVRKFNSPTWSPTVVASRTATGIQAKRVTSFSDFAIGKGTSYYLTATSTSQGSISPSGALVVAPGASQTYTMTPAAFSHVANVVVDGLAVGPVASYSFTGVAADHTIDASFALDSYTITASAGPHGAITPSGAVSVTRGNNQAFAIAPDAGYHVLDVLVDGVSVGPVASYAFTNVTAAHTISASFSINLFTLTASAGTHGTISPSGVVSVGYGASQTFTAAPDTGYAVLDVLVDGVSVGAVTSYTFSNVTAAHTIATSFALKVFTITASAGAGGTITPTGAVPVTYGASQAFTIASDPAHVVQDVVVDGASVGAVTSYTFSNVTATHTIAVTFANVFTITASTGAHGAISPTGAVSVRQGASQTFTITPDANYGVLDVLVDGASVGPVTGYTFTAVAVGHTIAASFAPGASVGAGPAPAIISSANTCVTIPVTLSRLTSEPVRAFSVSFSLSPGLELCAGTSSVGEGTFLSAIGTTFFHTTDLGGGHYRADGALLGLPCGPTGLTGTLFQLAVKSALASGSGTVAVDSVLMRDCDNHSLSVFAGGASTVTIDNVLPTVSLTSPNGGEVWTIGTTHAITWSASDNAAVDSVTIAYSSDGGATYPYAVAASLANAGTFSWVVPNTRSATARVRVIAHDHAGNVAGDASDADFEIREANVAPVLAAIGDKTVAEGTALTFTAAATDANLPAQALAFSLDAGAPAGASIVAATGVFTWTPTEAQGPGNFPLTVRVTDNGTPPLSATETLTIHVTEVNTPPVLTGVPAAASVPELAAYTFTAGATDSDLPAQTLVFSLVGGPAGASIDGTTGAFTWTPTEAQGPGSYPFSVRVSDGVANTDSVITVNVTEVNAAPALSGVPATASIPELAAYTFTATATDSDLPAQTLTFSLVGAPTGASIGATSGVFTWTPAEDQGPGSYPFSVRVRDGVTNTEAAIALTVTESNVAPVLSGVPATVTIPELAAYTFTATATDSDLPAQTLTFSLVGVPAGASINPSTGAFSWTPTEAQGPGVYSFSVRVGDGTANTDAAIALTVTETNAAPVLSNVPATATIPELAAYTFTATATDSDLPAQTLTFSLVGAPTGASIGATNGVFGWTPGEDQGPGSYPFTVRVSDGVTNTDAAIALTVTETNAAPVLSNVPATASIPELAAYTFTATATDVDLPAQTLAFSLVGAPTGASIGATSGVFAWTPTEAQGPGHYPFTVRVSDGVTNTDAAITIDVTEANVAPVLSAVPATATIPELAAYTFTATATDSDLPAQTLTFSLVGAPAGASINSSTGAFSWTPTEAQGPGTYPITVRVSDGTANTDAAISIDVTEVNVAPVLSDVPATAIIPELAAYTFTATATDSDSPGQTLTFSLVGTPPAGASIGASSGVFTWTPTEAQGPGTYPITVRVSDGTANTDAAIAITVSEVNAAPVLSGVPATATIPELAAYTFTATATDSDFPGQALTFSLVGTPPAGASIGASSGVFTWTPTEAQGAGHYPFTVRVTDGVTNADAAIAIDVTEVNTAPVLSNVPATASIPELAAYSFTATASDSDLPAQTLAFSLIGAPTGATIDGTTGAFSWTPTEAQGPGGYAFTVRVSDGVANADAAITLTVTEVNTAPVLSNVPTSATITEQVPYTFTATASDADLPAQSLSFSLVGAPAGAGINTSSGVFSWTPSNAQGPGTYAFSVQVTDGSLVASAPITLNVLDSNVAPVLSNVPATATIPELAAYTFTATATDADLPPQTLTFSLVGAPAGAGIGASSGVFTWTPTEAQGPGSYPFTVRVSDGVANTDAAITLTVTDVNSAPVLSGVPATASIPELAAYTFTATAIDSDVPVQSLTFSLVGAPTGASINAASGAFAWTPTEAQGPGSYPFSVRVSDGVVNTDAGITLTVTEVNAAPVLSGVPATATIPELAAYTFTATASDADLPPQTRTFSLVGAPTGAAIDGTTGVFTWTPTEAQGPASYPFSVRVSDGTANTDAAITLTVAEVNAAPVLAGVPATATIPELVAYTFTATATDGDLPAQTLTFSLVGAPTGAAIDGSTGAFSWTPTEAQGPASYPFTVRVSDGTANADAGVTLTVTETNAAPVLSGVPATATIPELAAYTFTATAADTDLPAQTLTFSLVGAPAGAGIGASSGVFTWTPTEAQGPGSFPFTVRVSDGVTNTDAAITLAVTEANASPVLANVPATASIPELAAYTFTATARDSDTPAQTLTFSLVGAPAGASIGAASGVFAWTPSETQGPGSYPFSVRVSDGTANTDAAITLNVTEVNAAPVLANVPATATIPELAAYTFTASATDSDVPAQSLTFSLVGAPAGASINATSGAFSWTPTEPQGPASYPFTVRVSDGVANTDAAITLDVTEVNIAPALSGVPVTVTIPELVAYTFTATASDADLPAQTLTFSLVGAPAGAGINGTSGVFTWTPTEAQGPGVYPFSVRVNDGFANTDAAISITVTEGNTAPVLSGVPATATIPELAAYTFTATATDSDVPTQTLTISLVGAPAGASIGAASGVFAWTPTETQGPGSYPFSVQVSDGSLTSSAAIVLTVSEVNALPIVSGVPATITIPELVAYTFTASATDSDLPAQSLAFSLVGAPPGAGIGAASGVFAWTPTEAQGPGVYAFSVRASDGVGATDAPITITVTEVTVPVIADLSATRLDSGNDHDGTVKIQVAWTATAPGTSVEVYRAGFGGYPLYDDAGGATPAVPSYPPGAGWTLTSLTAPGGTDEPATRDQYFYVAFVQGAGLNVSTASNRTDGTLDYQLGDFTNGLAAGTGDNLVTTADLSLLGSQYGISGAAVAPFAYLDVGPTSDGYVTGRPLTDHVLDFEDLVIVALNYQRVSGPQASARPASPPVSAKVDELSVGAPARVEAAGTRITAQLRLSGSGQVQGLSMALQWDSDVVRPLGATAGALLTSSEGVVFSPAPGKVDAVLLGTRSTGLTGEGDVAEIEFEVLRAGDPRIAIAGVVARDVANRPVTVGLGASAHDLPQTTALAMAGSNPFRGSTALELALAHPGRVEAELFSVDGRRVRRLMEGVQEPGVLRLEWNGRDDGGRGVPAGVYFLRVEADRQRFTRRLVLLP